MSKMDVFVASVGMGALCAAVGVCFWSPRNDDARAIEEVEPAVVRNGELLEIGEVPNLLGRTLEVLVANESDNAEEIDVVTGCGCLTAVLSRNASRKREGLRLRIEVEPSYQTGPFSIPIDVFFSGANQRHRVHFRIAGDRVDVSEESS